MKILHMVSVHEIAMWSPGRDGGFPQTIMRISLPTRMICKSGIT